MTKKTYRTIKQRRLPASGLLVLTIIIVVVILIAVVAAVIASQTAMGMVLDNSDISLSVSVSGNDLLVIVYPGGSADLLCETVLLVAGISEDSYLSRMPVPPGGGFITYSGLARGISGERSVSVRGIFSDGSSHMLFLDSVRFT